MAQTSTTTYRNEQHRIRREKLVKDFGSRCRHCKRRQGQLNIETGKDIRLEFAHKVNWRISGMNRGRNWRINEVARNPERFLLLCTGCHHKYDFDHPLTEAEKKAMAEEVPF